jgi:threonine/homoserine/homoserine lactone efflux protein
MILTPFWKSFSLTFTMLMAVGPICLTVINNTIIGGFLSGLSSGFGVIIADWIYIAIAVFFLEFATHALNNTLLLIFSTPGVVFLFYIAYKFWNTNEDQIVLKKNKIANVKSNFRKFIMLFFMTITGPTTIFCYSFVFSNFINDKMDNKFVAQDILLGASFATFLFYIFLVSIVSLLRQRMTNKIIIALNRFASLIILCFGFKILIKLIKDFINLLII